MGLCDSDVENMRERVEEKWEGKEQKDWTFLGRPLGLEAIDDLSLAPLFFFFLGASPERVMIQTQQFSKNLNTQLMASCKKM